MNEKTRTKIIAVFLIASLIWFVSNLDNDQKDTTAIEAPKAITPLSPGLQQAQKNLKQMDIETAKKKSWGRNPFQSSFFTEKATAAGIPVESLEWILSGIIYNNDPVAIINKKPIKIGGTIDNARVVQIEKEKVTIEYNKKQITLTVSKG